MDQDWDPMQLLNKKKTKQKSTPQNLFPSIESLNQSISLQDDDMSSFKSKTFNFSDDTQNNSKNKEASGNANKQNFAKKNKGENQKKQKEYAQVETAAKNNSREIGKKEISMKEVQILNQSIISDRIETLNYNNPKLVEQKDKDKGMKLIGIQKQTSKVNKQYPIKVVFQKGSYALVNQQSRLNINSQSLHQLYNCFFNKQFYIPMFRYQLYDHWIQSNDKDMMQPDHQLHHIFRNYFDRYVLMLNSEHQNTFLEVFKQLTESKQTKIKENKNNNPTIFEYISALNISSAIKGAKDAIINIISSNKTQILRETLLAKIRSLQEVKRVCGTDKDMIMSLQAVQAAQWSSLSEVQLLLSYQITQTYCQQNLKGDLLLKFKKGWEDYQEQIRKEKNNHIKTNLCEVML